MPIERCKLADGSSGYRWGKKGKCYKTRAAAEKQMKAIKTSQNKALEIRYGKKWIIVNYIPNYNLYFQL